MRAAVAALLVAVGIAGASAPAANPPWVILVEDCLTAAEAKRVVGFRASDRTRLVGVLLGRGSKGVVLVHGSNSTFCEWLWYARRLAKQYRVLALDLRGYGSSYPAPRGLDVARFDRDVAAAAAQLRKRGATKVFAIGSSLGAGAVVVAAGSVRPPLAGVVSLSAPASTSPGFDTVASVRKARVPFLFVAGREDRDFAADAELLHAEAVSEDKRLLIMPGTGHGSGLLTQPAPATAVRRFLAEH